MDNGIDRLLSKAIQARSQAYAPYSNFSVGCAIRSNNNQFYIGANVENIAYGATQCAEASAIGAMIAAGERQINDILIVATPEVLCPPCGNCRQLIAEFANDSTKIHLCQHDKLVQTLSWQDCLPYTFHKIATS